MPIFQNYLTAPWKIEYIKQKKDPNQCILCAIAQKTTGVEAWEVYRNDQIMVLLNRFPYNPGHLLLAPLEHYKHYEALSHELVTNMAILIQKTVILLKQTHQPKAFNIGLNVGNYAGGSIKHLHWHIVPRYLGDLNFMEILQTRILVESLQQTLTKLRQHVDILLQER